MSVFLWGVPASVGGQLCCSFFIFRIMGKYKDCLTRSVYLFFFPHEFTGSFIGMTLRVHALLTQTMTQTMKLHSLQRTISKPQWLLLHFVSFIHLPTTLHLYKPAWTLFQHILTTNPSGNPLLSYFNEQCHFPLLFSSAPVESFHNMRRN